MEEMKKGSEVSSEELSSSDLTGVAGGKVSMQDLHITRPVDKSSPNLFTAAAPQPASGATGELTGDDLRNVVGGTQAKEAPTESVSLNFGKIAYKYEQQG